MVRRTSVWCCLCPKTSSSPSPANARAVSSPPPPTDSRRTNQGRQHLCRQCSQAVSLHAFYCLFWRMVDASELAAGQEGAFGISFRQILIRHADAKHMQPASEVLEDSAATSTAVWNARSRAALAPNSKRHSGPAPVLLSLSTVLG